jgi:hypothetical protein
LADYCGLAFNRPKLHLRVIRNLLATRFPSGTIRWRELQCSDLAEFFEEGVPPSSQLLDAESLANGGVKICSLFMVFCSST